MPVRKIPVSTVAVTGQHARTGANYESGLERDFFELMTHDPLLDSAEEQPVTIHYVDKTGRKKRYTPDALVKCKADPETGIAKRPMLVEVKYRDELKEKFPQLKERFRAACRYARARGWVFKIFTDVKIRGVKFKNKHFLNGYRDINPVPVHQDAIVVELRRSGSLAVSDLLSRLTPDRMAQAAIIPTMWWMVGHGELCVDLNSPLTMSAQIVLPA